VLVAACGCRARQPGRLHARLILQPHDTLQVTADAWVRRCGDGRGFLLEGVVGGNGVLLWLHGGDAAMGGEYPVLARGDTVTPRGFAGAVRFMLPTADRGVTLDSGVVTVSSAGARMDARARGSGIDPGAGQRVVLDALFQAVPMAADTVNCRVQLRP
jgi:hypothetical protein